MEARDWAAWVGAGLGVFNLMLGLWARRPFFGVCPPTKLSLSGVGAAVQVTAGASQLIIRDIWVFPSRANTQLYQPLRESGERERQHSDWTGGRPFRCLIRPDETGTIQFVRGERAPARLMVIWWSDQRFQPFPFSVVRVDRKRLQLLHEAIGRPFDD